jgi:hypothetical protein
VSLAEALGSAAGLLLAALFAWAAAAKAIRPDQAAADVARLGVPAARVVARVVPLAEMLLAVTLLWRPGAGAVGALTLLAAFSAVLWRARARGTMAGCACFGPGGRAGRLSTALLRNALLGLAALVAAQGAPGVAPLPALVAVGAATVAGLLALALWDLRARTGRLWDNRVALAGRMEEAR